MNKNLFGRYKLVACLLAISAAIFSGCKNEKTTRPKTTVNNATSKFQLNGAGDHADFEVSCAVSGKALEIGGTSLANGGTADQSTYFGTQPGFTNQKWKITDQGTGYYKLMNLGSGKYLQAPTSGSGVQVIQDQSNTSDQQLWSIINVGPGAYEVLNKQSGLVLTDHGASTNDVAPVTQETYANNNSQWWNFTLIAADSYRDDDVVRFFHRTSGSEAFDGGASIPLPTGQVLWVTNDVFYNQLNAKGEFNCGQIFNYHNSLLIQPANHDWDSSKTVNVLSPNGVQIFHDSNSRDLLWPGAGIQLGTHVYVHTIEVPIGTLSTDNQFLCDITGASDGKSINAVIPLTIPGMSGQTAITYSLGMVKASDGYVYAYGAGGFLGAGIYVARFPQSSPTSWTFWNGTTWASTPTNASAAQVANGPINNNTVGFVNGKYVIIEMDYGFTCDATGRNMYVSTGTSPIGPFTSRKLVYQLPDKKQGHEPVYYNPTIHAEFDNGQNELLVNYCVNFYSKNDGTGAYCLTPCSNPDGSEDPSDYRPKGVRIPYSLIGL